MNEQVEISELGRRGDGIGQGTNGRLYVPLSAPGDVLSVHAKGKKHVIDDIVTPSEFRIKAACPKFGICGGCLLQHVVPDFVANWKRDLITSALEYEGLRDVDVAQTFSVPEGDRRRAEVKIVRTKKSAILGFNARGSSDVIDLNACLVLVPEIPVLFGPLRELFANLLDPKQSVKVLITAMANGLDVNVSSPKELPMRILPQLAGFADDQDLARLSWNQDLVVERRAPLVSFGAMSGRITPGAFLQASTTGQDFLIEQVRDGLKGTTRIVDLFAGAGTFSLSQVDKRSVHAVEADETMLSAITRSMAGVQGTKPVTTEQRDLFQRPLLAVEFKKFDGAIFDPPRSGARDQTGYLAISGLPVIMGVSCNPESFAKDARTLVSSGYVLEWVKPLDQFRHSPHVELVAKFTRPA